jgi:hypothetical protein
MILGNELSALGLSPGHYLTSEMEKKYVFGHIVSFPLAIGSPVLIVLDGKLDTRHPGF